MNKPKATVGKSCTPIRFEISYYQENTLYFSTLNKIDISLHTWIEDNGRAEDIVDIQNCIEEQLREQA